MKQIVTFIAFFLLSMTAVFAQSEDAPLVVTRYEDNAIYIVEDGELVQVCESNEARAAKYNSGFAQISTTDDGMYIIFATWANGDIDRNEFPDLSNPYLKNHWLCDLETGDAMLLPREENIFQSLPIFSPDETQLVWAQTTGEDTEYEIIIYDLETAEQRIRAILDAEMVRNQMPYLDWSSAGIAISELAIRGNNQEQQQVILLDPEADLDSESLLFTYDEPVNSALRAVWVEYEGEQRLWLESFPTEGISLISRDFETIDLVPSSYKFYFQREQDGNISRFEASVGDYLSMLPRATGASDEGIFFAVSPDNNQIAYLQFDNAPYGGDLYITDIDTQENGTGTPTGRLVGIEATNDEAGIQSIIWGSLDLVLLEEE